MNWTHLRAAVIARDGFRCRECGRPFPEPGQRLAAHRGLCRADGQALIQAEQFFGPVVHHVDHVTPGERQALGPKNDPSNLVTVCRPCHLLAHGKRARRHSVVLDAFYAAAYGSPTRKPAAS